MNKRGFTLVEMIVVVVLIGVVSVVAIPAVLKAMNTQDNERYDTHMKLVKQALDLYAIRYKGSFDNGTDINTYKLNYSKLISNELLTENGLTCGGYIYLTKKKNNNYSYYYYLTCIDNKNHKTYVDNNKTSLMPACNTTTKCVEISN